MAHHIENNEMFSVRETPWHGLGTVLADYPSTAEALVAAGLDWQVLEEPIYTSDMQVIPGFKRTIRGDNGKTLGVVGEKFATIQNATMFAAAEAVAGTQEALWETAGPLDGGKRVWALMKLDKSLYIAGEKLDPYFVITQGHDGRNSLCLKTTPIRVVCHNTLTAAIGSGKKKNVGTFVIRHTKNYEELLAEAVAKLGLVKNYYENFATFAENLVAQKFAKAAFEKLVETLVPIAVDAPARTKTMAISVREAMLVCREARDLDAIRDTKWGAFNAVADWSDHFRATRNTPGADERAYTRTFEDTEIKDRALALLVG